MLAMPDRRTQASAGYRTTQAGAGRLTFHMSVAPGMPVHGTNRTNRATLMMSANRMILLQKSFCTRYQKFRGPQVRFSCRDLRDLIASR
jgi:hypothetical protein